MEVHKNIVCLRRPQNSLFFYYAASYIFWPPAIIVSLDTSASTAFLSYFYSKILLLTLYKLYLDLRMNKNDGE